jgi:hypothetical protein
MSSGNGGNRSCKPRSRKGRDYHAARAQQSPPGVHSVAAYRENSHVFAPIAPLNANAPTDTCNVRFGFPAKQGCIAVYAPEGKSVGTGKNSGEKFSQVTG